MIQTFKKTELGKKMLVVALILLLIGSVLGVAIDTSFGTVKHERLRLVSDSLPNGGVIDGTLYIPKTATEQTPAPLVVLIHGGNCDRGTMSSYANELSRRGYVVYTGDSYSNGGSDFDPTGNAPTPAIVAMKYLKALNFVDTTRIGIAGHSRGGRDAVKVLQYNNNEFGIRSLMTTGYANSLSKVFTPQTPVNFGTIVGYTDQNEKTAKALLSDKGNISMFGIQSGSIVDGQWYGNVANNTARVAYNPPLMFHLSIRISPYGTSMLTNFFDTTLDHHSSVAPTNQTYMYRELATAMIFVGIICLIIALVNILVKAKFFAKIEGEECAPQPSSGPKMYGSLILIALFASFSLEGLTAQGIIIFPKISSNIFMLRMINGLYLWVIVLSVFMLAVNLIVKKTNRQYNFKEEAKAYRISWSKLWRTFVLALLIVAICYGFVVFAMNALNLQARLIYPQLSVLTPLRLKLMFVYFWPFLFMQLVASYVQVTTFRTVNKGPKFFLVMAILANTLGLLLHTITDLLTKSFGVSFGNSALATTLGLYNVNSSMLSPILNIMFMAFFTAFITAAAYKKTKNIYLGTFINALLFTWLACAGVFVGS